VQLQLQPQRTPQRAPLGTFGYSSRPLLESVNRSGRRSSGRRSSGVSWLDFVACGQHGCILGPMGALLLTALPMTGNR
jgi:hypothetical protein